MPVATTEMELPAEPQSLKKRSLKSLKLALDIFSHRFGHFPSPDTESKKIRMSHKLNVEYGGIKSITNQPHARAKSDAQDQVQQASIPSHALALPVELKASDYLAGLEGATETCGNRPPQDRASCQHKKKKKNVAPAAPVVEALPSRVVEQSINMEIVHVEDHETSFRRVTPDRPFIPAWSVRTSDSALGQPSDCQKLGVISNEALSAQGTGIMASLSNYATTTIEQLRSVELALSKSEKEKKKYKNRAHDAERKYKQLLQKLNKAQAGLGDRDAKVSSLNAELKLAAEKAARREQEVDEVVDRAKVEAVKEFKRSEELKAMMIENGKDAFLLGIDYYKMKIQAKHPELNFSELHLPARAAPAEVDDDED